MLLLHLVKSLSLVATSVQLIPSITSGTDFIFTEGQIAILVNRCRSKFYLFERLAHFVLSVAFVANDGWVVIQSWYKLLCGRCINSGFVLLIARGKALGKGFLEALDLVLCQVKLLLLLVRHLWVAAHTEGGWDAWEIKNATTLDLDAIFTVIDQSLWYTLRQLFLHFLTVEAHR